MKKAALVLMMSVMMSTPTLASSFTPTKVEEANKRIEYEQYDYKPMYTTTGVNLRKEPTTESESLGVLPVNTLLYVAKYNDDWSLVRYSETEYYYICSQYLSDTEVEVKSYTEDDLYCLSHIINAEMGDESWEDKIYTGSVVLNRVAGDSWWSSGERTIRAVVFRKNPLQYGPIKNGSFWNEPNAESVRAAEFLLQNGTQIPSSVVYQAEFKQGSGIWQHTSAAYYCYQ